MHPPLKFDSTLNPSRISILRTTTTVINTDDPINSARMSVFTVQFERIFERFGFVELGVPQDDLSAVISRVVEAKEEYDVRLLAQQLGTNYRSLMYWLRGERHLPAHLLPRMCILLNNYEALDLLESQAGRVAFKLPKLDVNLEEELAAVSSLIREVGEALESVGETLADGIVEDRELKVTIPKLEAVIRECAALKYLLEEMGAQRKKKKTRDHSNR
jgi:hypothetical protein